MPLKPNNDACKSKNAAPGAADTLVSSLDNDKWITKRRVAIFDQHDGAEEGLAIDFTPDVLQTIVDQNNDRVKKGSLVPITVGGHTEGDGTPPDDEDIVGWAENFFLDVLDDDTKAIFCDMK